MIAPINIPSFANVLYEPLWTVGFLVHKFEAKINFCAVGLCFLVCLSVKIKWFRGISFWKENQFTFNDITRAIHWWISKYSEKKRGGRVWDEETASSPAFLTPYYGVHSNPREPTLLLNMLRLIHLVTQITTRWNHTVKRMTPHSNISDEDHTILWVL